MRTQVVGGQLPRSLPAEFIKPEIFFADVDLDERSLLQLGLRGAGEFTSRRNAGTGNTTDETFLQFRGFFDR